MKHIAYFCIEYSGSRTLRKHSQSRRVDHRSRRRFQWLEVIQLWTLANTGHLTWNSRTDPNPQAFDKYRTLSFSRYPVWQIVKEYERQGILDKGQFMQAVFVASMQSFSEVTHEFTRSPSGINMLEYNLSFLKYLGKQLAAWETSRNKNTLDRSECARVLEQAGSRRVM